jgi:aminoglycoside phosphotransferase family enzyme
VVEWTVKMRRLPDGYFLHQLLGRSRVDSSTLGRIVVRLKAFYLAQHPTREIEAWGRIARLKISTNENFEQIKPFVGRTLSVAGLDAIRFYTEVFYRRRKDLFLSRTIAMATCAWNISI